MRFYRSEIICFILFAFIVTGIGSGHVLFADEISDIQNDLEEKGVFGTIIDINVGINVDKKIK